MEIENKIKYYILAIYKPGCKNPDFAGIQAYCPEACFELPEIKNLPKKHKIQDEDRNARTI